MVPAVVITWLAALARNRAIDRQRQIGRRSFKPIDEAHEVPDEAEMLRRMQDILARGFPYLVAEIDGQVERLALDSAFGIEVQPHQVARIRTGPPRVRQRGRSARSRAPWAAPAWS